MRGYCKWKKIMRSQYCFNQLQFFLSNKSNKIITAYLHVGGAKLEIVLWKTSQFFAPHWQLIIPCDHASVNDWEVPLRFKGVKQRSSGKETFFPLPHESPAYFGFLFTKNKKKKKKPQNHKQHPTSFLQLLAECPQGTFIAAAHTPLVFWLWLTGRERGCCDMWEEAGWRRTVAWAWLLGLFLHSGISQVG